MVICTKPGCQTSAGCRCNVGQIVLQPVGCICPPTAERTCQRPDCPRKGFTGTTTITYPQAHHDPQSTVTMTFKEFKAYCDRERTAAHARGREEGLEEAAKIADPIEDIYDGGSRAPTDYEKQAYDLRWNIARAIRSRLTQKEEA